MKYIFDFDNSVSKSDFFICKHYLESSQLQYKMMVNLLKLKPGNSLLNIGCGSGLLAVLLSNIGLAVTATDSSVSELKFAIKNTNDTINFYNGLPVDLPFEDKSFDFVCLILTSQQVINGYKRIISEACRVAKDSVFVVGLNRYSFHTFRIIMRSFYTAPKYSKLRFFSIWELVLLIHEILGSVSTSWQTTGCFPKLLLKFINKFKNKVFINNFPFGAFIGVAIYLNSQSIATPLKLGYVYNELNRFIVV